MSLRQADPEGLVQIRCGLEMGGAEQSLGPESKLKDVTKEGSLYSLMGWEIMQFLLGHNCLNSSSDSRSHISLFVQLRTMPVCLHMPGPCLALGSLSS